MLANLKANLFRAFGDWAIARAMRTPYFHVTHADGEPYMDRFWLFRLGGSSEIGCEPSRHPWASVRVHHIRSDDWPVFHDHPWTFATLILRGGYTEVTPVRPGESVIRLCRYFGAGSLRLVRAQQWHFLELGPETTAWTLVVTFRKVQGWGFLVNGVKVPWRQYLAQRAAAKSEGVSA